MKVDLLGAKCFPSAGKTDQTVVPLVGLPAESVQVKAVPPQGWTSMPRCFLYHSRRALGSLALMKMPPMPVTLRIRASERGRGGRRERCSFGPQRSNVNRRKAVAQTRAGFFATIAIRGRFGARR